MGMVLTESQITDLTMATLRELGWGRFNQISQSLQRYEAFNRIYKTEKIQEDEGYGIQRDVLLGTSNQARNVGLYAEDEPFVPDGLQQITADWRHVTTNWSLDRRELEYNTGRSQIVRLITVRRTMAMLSLIELLEKQFWSKPSSSTDTSTLWGLLYWIVYSGTAAITTGSPYGFTGGAASGFSAGPGNLSPTTYPAWNNWSDTYTYITKQDLIFKMRLAADFTEFQSPVDVPDFRKGSGQDYRWYCSLPNHLYLANLGESQNENLGRDLASMDGMMTFRRNPIVAVPALNVYGTSNPFYGINWSYFYPVALRGEWLRESQPIWLPLQHTVQVVYMDCTLNSLCTDRRRQIVIAKSDPQNGN